MNVAARLILSASMLAFAASAAAQAPVTAPAVPAAQQSAHDRLFQLFKESDEASLKRNPLQALFRGDLRYADRLGDLFSDAHYQGEKAAAEHDLAALQRDPARRAQRRPTSSPTTCSNIRPRTRCAALQPDLLTLTEALPMNHFFGIHTEYPTIASGQGGAPYNDGRRL